MSEFAVAQRNRRVLEARWPELNTRKTPEGTEKLCGQCQEWLPLDEEFFSFIPSQGHYRSWCKCCEAESARLRRAIKRAPSIAGKVADRAA